MSHLGYRIFVPFQMWAKSCKVPESIQDTGTTGGQCKRSDRHHACLYQEEHNSQEHSVACIRHDQFRVDPIIISFMKVLQIPVPWHVPQHTHIILCLIQVSPHGRKQGKHRQQRWMAVAILYIKLMKVPPTGPQGGHGKRVLCKLF